MRGHPVRKPHRLVAALLHSLPLLRVQRHRNCTALRRASGQDDRLLLIKTAKILSAYLQVAAVTSGRHEAKILFRSFGGAYEMDYSQKR